jgi:hypothetical protein
MDKALQVKVNEAKEGALAVLLNNEHGPIDSLPRVAGWGYPEPYTRDLMISSLGVLASGNDELIQSLRRVFIRLAENQTPHGHVPSFVHDPRELGASDTTPLFLMALAIYRRAIGEDDFLADAASQALTWMEYQSPGDEVLVGQLPTSDWRDEQWVLGFGLYVNAVVYIYLRLFSMDDRADNLQRHMNTFAVCSGEQLRQNHWDPSVPCKPYYALWAYKVFSSGRFDLLGNSLAIIAGIPEPERAQAIIRWVEDECSAMRARGELAVDLPPSLFPYIRPGDQDWLSRYARYNQPGEYHNGGIWPFICGFYVVAQLAAGFPELAERSLAALTDVVHLSQDKDLPFGFNEWIRAQDGIPHGQDWQTWSASMYLYAAACVEQRKVLFFDEFRNKPFPADE